MLCGAGSPLHQRLLQWDTELLGMGILKKSTYNIFKTNKKCQTYIFFQKRASQDRKILTFMYIFKYLQFLYDLRSQPHWIFKKLHCWFFMKYAFLPAAFLLHACLKICFFLSMLILPCCFFCYMLFCWMLFCWILYCTDFLQALFFCRQVLK